MRFTAKPEKSSQSSASKARPTVRSGSGGSAAASRSSEGSVKPVELEQVETQSEQAEMQPEQVEMQREQVELQASADPDSSAGAPRAEVPRCSMVSTPMQLSMAEYPSSRELSRSITAGRRTLRRVHNGEEVQLLDWDSLGENSYL
jgi:hypothetical protein